VNSDGDSIADAINLDALSDRGEALKLRSVVASADQGAEIVHGGVVVHEDAVINIVVDLPLHLRCQPYRSIASNNGLRIGYLLY
jgi:hypothetical protein